jgi:hypothetical protein
MSHETMLLLLLGSRSSPERSFFTMKNIKVTPLPVNQKTPFPVMSGDDMASAYLECSILFHDLVGNLLRDVVELKADEVFVVKGSDYGLSSFLGIGYRNKSKEYILDDPFFESPLSILDDIGEEEADLYRRVCEALHESVPVVPWEAFGSFKGCRIDLITSVPSGAWMRGSRGHEEEEWFRVLVPGRIHDAFWPINIYSQTVEGKKMTLECMEGTIMLDLI